MDGNQTRTEGELSEELKRRPAKPRKWLAVILFLVVAGVLLLPLLHKPKATNAPGGPPGPGGGPGGRSGAVPVDTAVVSVEPMNVYLDALGTVTPEHTVNVYSQVNGRVVAVNYTEGQMVSAGQSLVEVDPRPYEALLAQAKGSLARDRVLLEQARVNAKRYEDAFKRNAIAQQALFDQQQSVKQYEGTVQNDEGAVQYYEVQLSYCHIAAPISGKVGLRLVDPGNTIFSGASSTLAVITQLDPITVVFSIAEDHLPTIQQQLRKTSALKVELYDRGQSKRLATGTLLALDNQVDTTTGTLKFRAKFANPNGSILFPNQFVNVRLLLDTLRGARQLPTVAIQYNGSQAFVYVVNADHTVTIRNITVTTENNNKSAVEGLDPGTVVVTSNFDRLENGAKIVPSRAGGAPANQGAAGAVPPRGRK